MKGSLKEALHQGFLLIDGAMGTMLQEKGLEAGMQPEYFNVTHPEIVAEIHRAYVKAGADIITANTFQANGHKIPAEKLPEIITAAIRLAKSSGATFVAYDMGPIGALLQPLGTMSFEEAYDLFAQQAKLAEAAGADLVILETMSDLLETKAAMLAIKENTDLPIFVTMTYQGDGRTFVGCDPVTATLTLQALGAEAVGLNCSLGPAELLPLVEQVTRFAKVPVIVQANAGLPEMVEGQTVYRLSAADYSQSVAKMLALGVRVVGGCCGTTPEFIREMRSLLDRSMPATPKPQKVTAVTSGVETVMLDNRLTIIGERLNPTGKKRLQAAIRQKDFAYLLKEAIQQVNDGGEILDVNVGLPEIDEAAMMKQVVEALQSVINVPLQIDSSSVAAIEAGVRTYNGRPLINSVNGKPEVMAEIFPIAKKYGALVLGLALDEGGIPRTAKGRLAVAQKIVETAASFGIAKEDILIDPLVLTASAQQDQVAVTLETLKLLKELGVQTVAGISNVSFGLPNRPLLNSTFLAAAAGAGLSAPILNPASAQMMATVRTLRVINQQDLDAKDYITHCQDLQFGLALPKETADGKPKTPKDKNSPEESLRQLILQGRKEETPATTQKLLVNKTPLEIVNEEFIPALDEVGQKFEAGTLFLPQLMQSAEAVKGAQEVLKTHMAAHESQTEGKGRILLATVAGDIHDIGKNIVKMMLENYGFEVVDLGKDVPIETVVATIRQEKIQLAGLSALMTTTVQNMKKTIAAVKAAGLDCSFMVGGAVLNEDYREFVGADYYAKDAMESVTIAQEFFAQHKEG
ncbi:homocysteine S-methyltransferase family protein [Enterococcus asini]|uniref:homocysteine S-methyltransferase family protein n=1 Tax=Enterococcus asini TaxID=57732 RepID=UPI00288D34AF|nr:homocysteine S-methyltransferase family protein [Enterococcus asini]MDT2757720.1 homocysteine S-methyltransferase family protein [Enterococcus asini]